MEFPPIPRSLLALVLALAALPDDAQARRRLEDPAPPSTGSSYRADALAPVAPGVPREVRLLLPMGEEWPERVRESLEARVREEWNASQVYGAVQTAVGVELRWPLVTARVGPGVLVPVVSGTEATIEGRVALPERQGPRRVVLLVDASSSANARIQFPGADAKVSVLDAELRALSHLVDRLGDEWLELGVIAFGEETWPLAPPGASRAELRQALAAFRAAHPSGEGRTDTVCALWTARDWLRDTPRGVAREIVLLTDGDAPHSGRFTECRGRGGSACADRRNTTVCPASRGLSPRGGADEAQIASFARRNRDITVHPLVFELDRRATVYRELAIATGGQLVRVPSAEAIEVALPALVSSRLGGVFARNLRTGAATGNLRRGEELGFEGRLGLLPGPNDIELRVESDRGLAALYRFRVYSAEGYLDRFLAELRERNRTLEVEVQEGLGEALTPEQRRRRSVTIEAPPAAPE